MKAKAAVDTSVVVAALMGWHERHEAASRWLSRVLESGNFVLPEAVLIESYAVMTRLPAPHRLSPGDAIVLLEENFRNVSLAGLPARSVWPVLRRLAADGSGGGITYDAAILEAARRGGAKIFATFNARDFERLNQEGIEIVVPESTPGSARSSR